MSLNKSHILLSSFAGVLLTAGALTTYQCMKQPTFSLIISTYNTQKTISEIFSSLNDQEFKDFEVIFIDNGSTDNTFNLIKEYADQHHYVSFLQKQEGENLGSLSNKAYQQARGKYIALLDDNDVLYPEWLKEASFTLNEQPQIVGLVADKKTLPGNVRVKTDIVESVFSNTLSDSGLIVRTDFMKEHDIHHADNIQAAFSYDVASQILMNKGVIRSLGRTFIRNYTTNTRPDVFNRAKSNESHTISLNLQKYFKNGQDKTMTPCELYLSIKDSKEFSPLFAENELQRSIDRTCKAEFAHLHVKWEFVHPYWRDQITVNDDNRFKRVNGGDAGVIQSIKGNEVTVKWDRWPAETFVCDKNDVCVLKKK